MIDCLVKGEWRDILWRGVIKKYYLFVSWKGNDETSCEGGHKEILFICLVKREWRDILWRGPERYIIYLSRERGMKRHIVKGSRKIYYLFVSWKGNEETYCEGVPKEVIDNHFTKEVIKKYYYLCLDNSITRHFVNRR